MSEILVCRRSFVTRQKNQTIHVYKGDHADSDHAVVRALPDAFRPINVKFPTGTEKQSRSAKKLPEGTPVP